MNHFGLFEGIGGFSLAARWMGWNTVGWCEIDPFCQTVLKHHFPEAIGYGDIKTTDFSPWAGKIDILTGGFPCQPFSQAGKRKGTSDDRHLWPEMLRAIREIQPSYIVGENVNGILNWSRGLVFEQVHADLEAQGYEVQSFVLPACSIGAPHKRERIWFIANSAKQGLEGCKRQVIQGGGKRSSELYTKNFWADFKAEWLWRVDDDGISSQVGGICIPESRKPLTSSVLNKETIKMAGNAIVPQVAFQIFKAIEATS